MEQQIERLRSFIRKRLAAAEDEGRKISGRLDAVEHAHDVAETLALLIVAQDSLFLFQQMRVLRIKATQPEFAPAATAEARALLDQHTTEDADLLQRLRTLVDERVEVEALEVLRFRTTTQIVESHPRSTRPSHGSRISVGSPYESLDVPPLPSAAEVVDEVKERGSALASGSKRAIGELAGKVSSTGSDRRPRPRLPSSSPGMSLQRCPRRPWYAAEADPEQSAGRFSKLRLSAMSRVRRVGGAMRRESHVESDRADPTEGDV